MKVLVLGGSGMLGSMVTDYLSRDLRLEVSATARNDETLNTMKAFIPTAGWIYHAYRSDLPHALPDCDWYINCIGVTKPCIDESSTASISAAIATNSLSPFYYAQKAEESTARMIQIATDCVYSGKVGMYGESEPHDALDVYGKTKSLGEPNAEHVTNLRCSIIGPEAIRQRFLLEWVRNQPKNELLEGYGYHVWNGITTYHFAKICKGIILENNEVLKVQHIVPFDCVTKYELLCEIAKVYGRDDLKIAEKSGKPIVDRELVTEHEEINANLWRAAGYVIPPTIHQMLKELKEYDYLSRS